MTTNLDDVAYISISATPDCARVVINDVNEISHYIASSDNVLNLNFDDVIEDIKGKDNDGKDVLYKAITEEQADKIISFIEKNLDKHIIIHCRAGKSRSQGVYRAIMDCYGDYYGECPYNNINPCITPNIEVVRLSLIHI